MKRLISVILAVLIIMAVPVGVSAVNSDAPASKLHALFSKGKGSEVSGISIEYSYYSPVKDDSDENKYPLVIFMAGLGNANAENKELWGNSYPRWAGQDLQAKFTNGGAYLMFLRSREDLGLYWDSTRQLAPAKKAVDEFIAQNPNVDTGRIYLLGWSLGGVGVKNYAVTYPDSVAGIVMISASTAITASEAQLLKNKAVWVFQSLSDAYAVAAYGNTSWSNLKSCATDKKTIRFSTADSAPNSGACFSHNMWIPATYDMAKGYSDYENFRTVDGSGNEIAFASSMIEWLTAHSSYVDENCTHACHSSGIPLLIWKFKQLFFRYFRMNSNRLCECGKAHW